MTRDPWRRLLGWLGIVPGRVLQIDEICLAALERLRADALDGLSIRYLPATVTVEVSPDDEAILRRFEPELKRSLRSRVDALVAEGGFSKTSPEVGVSLASRQGLRAGDAPHVATAFGPAMERATWSPDGAGDSSGRERGGPLLLELVVTAQGDDATALQERFLVALGPGSLPSGLSRDGEEGEERAVPTGTTGTASARLFRADGRQPGLAWSAAGMVVLGREKGSAHVVPSVPVATMSAAHLALQTDADGRLLVADLATSNGSWIGGERLGTGWRAVSPPFAVAIGAGGRARVDVRVAGAQVR